jgi:hypothetical protein
VSTRRLHRPPHFLTSLRAALLLLCCFAQGVAATDGAAAAEPAANLIGINIAAPLDYEEDRLYADVMHMSRPFTAGLDENNSSAGPAPLDANGWPTADFSFYVWAGLGKMQGTYTLSFTGQASVYAHPVGNVAIAYDPATNTSTGTIQVANAAESFLALRFSATRRTAGSVLGSGVTAIRLMRPLVPGSAQSYPQTTLFSTPIKTLIAKFSVIRFMDFLATNANRQATWSERMLPAAPSFSRNPGDAYGWQGLGGPWEHVILLANETGKDAWINLPALATDAYVENVARVLRYGSDGVNPYSGPQANPVYPPLAANLKIYVEYSNELWNSAGAFTQFHDNCYAAGNELLATSGNSPLNWDNSWNGTGYNREAPGNWNWDMCWRRIAKRGVEVSNIFRGVFGDAAMGTRIRPLLMTQLGAPGRILAPTMQMMLDYYDNMAGDFVATPRPPSYYFFGAGGSAYYGPAPTVTTLDALFADSGMKPAGISEAFQGDAALVAAMGLQRVAYEGGPSLDRTGGAVDALYAQAVNDPRMTTTMVAMHDAWSNNSGELLVYYRATGDYQWGFTDDIDNLATPKLLAIDALNAAPRAALTFGTPVPGTVAGNIPDTCSRHWGCTPLEPWDNFTADGSRIIWASYSFRSPAPAQWLVSVSVTGATNARVAVYVDGTLLGTLATTGGILSFNSGMISAGLHGVVVRAVGGQFTVSSVAVALAGSPPLLQKLIPGYNSMRVFFAAPPPADGLTIIDYTATCIGGGHTVTQLGLTSPIVVKGLVNGISYTCSVHGRTSSGNTQESSSASRLLLPAANIVPVLMMLGDSE